MFSAAVLILILSLMDTRRITQIIAGANIQFILLALAAYSCTMLLMSYRLRRILAELGENISPAASFYANAAGLLASDFTPARSGYFITPLVLERNASVDVDKGMAAIVSPQIVEFFLKAAGAAAAVLLLLSTVPELSGSAFFLLAGVGVMLVFCALLWAALFSPAILRFLACFEFVPFVKQGKAFISSLQLHGGRISGIFAWISAVSAAVFALKGVEWYFFGLAVGVSFSVKVPPILVFLVLQPLITVFQFVPFPTIAGLGLSEGSAIASMALLGVPTELAVAYSLLVRAGTTLLDCIGIAHLSPFISPRNVSLAEKPKWR
jgi:uncharacterized membrane protein YbhN (UPF0104 family)